MKDIFAKLKDRQAENLAVAYRHPSYMLECELDAAMTACDRERSLEMLRTINRTERAHLSDDPLHSLQLSLICGCTCYARTAIRAGVDAEIAFDLSDLYIREIDATRERSALLELEKAMMLGFIGLIEKQRAERMTRNAAVNKMIQYIRGNVNHHVSLAELSSAVGMHPVYLSSLFTKETGMSVSDFIDLSRIRAICGFLAETELKMLEIAELFSFSSAAHFSAYFKQHTGLTPRGYRSACRQGKTPPSYNNLMIL